MLRYIHYTVLLTILLAKQLTTKQTFLASIDDEHSTIVLTQIKRLGLTVLPIGLKGWYQLHGPDATMRLKQSTPSLWRRRLYQLPGINSLSVQREKKVSLRQGLGPLNDPQWRNGFMWYWERSSSMHVQQVWEQGFTGRGVQIAIIDDGVDHRNQEFQGRFNFDLSFDYTRMTKDARPAYGQTHGTKVAGVAAGALGNNFCGGGAAPRATVVGVRLISFSGSTTPGNEASSLVGSKRHLSTDIFVASWGAVDDGQTVDGPEQITKDASKEAATKGRNGKGSLFIVAAGNGGANNDDCICDGYASGEYAIAVQAVNRDGTAPYYTESCATAMTSVYVDDGLVAPLPVAFTPSCSLGFAGTSAAAPAAAGVLALVLEHRPDLTRRDLLHLIVHASDPSGLDPSGWITTGAHFRFHVRFGFGLLDAQKLDKLADSWTLLSNVANPFELRNTSFSSSFNSLSYGFADNRTGRVERVSALLSIKPLFSRGDIEVFILSPLSTKVPILNKRASDRTTDKFKEWDFSTVAFWDEPLNGTWKVDVINGTVNFIKFQVTASVDVETTTTSATTTLSATTTTNHYENQSTSKHLRTEHIVIICIVVFVLGFAIGMIFFKFVVSNRKVCVKPHCTCK